MIYCTKQNPKIPKNLSYRIGILLLFILLLGNSSLLAQNTVIKGVVTDATNNESLPGVNVLVEGTTLGSVTDLDGKFQISVPSPNATLVFSFIGYISEKVALAGQSTITVSLVADIKALDEVVVIGYGSVKKKDLTGSVSSLSGDKIRDLPVNSAAEALTGKLAGVQVTTTEGSPDAEIKIRVRGGGSITRDNAPLYIVDGFPVDRISDIPPTDIQSYDVLKDASSTAIYGSRGANGVIIITTKKPSENKITASYSGYYSIKNVAKKLNVLSPYEFAKWQYEQAVLQNKTATQYEAYFGSFDDMDLYKSMNGTDWQDVVFGRTGTTQNHSFSINGGSKTSSFNASYNRINDKAIMLGSDFIRDNLSLKLNANPLKWLKTGFTVRYSDTKVNGAGANDVTGTEKSTSDSRLKNAVIYTPISLANITVPDDDPESASSLYPPTTTIADNDRFRQRKNYNINGEVSIDLTKWLVFRSEIGMDYTREFDNRFFGLTNYYVTNGNASIKNQPAAQLTNTDETSFRNSNTLTSTYKLNEHHFSLMVGEETLNKNITSSFNSIDGYPVFFTSDQTWSFTSQGTSKSFSNFYSPDDKMLSFFGRLNYDLEGKYLATITFRADGSSKFAPGNQWGYFPSAALAWRVSDEQFFSGLKEVISNFKLRASYGTAGNNRIDALSYMQVFNSIPNKENPSIYIPSSLGTSYWAAGNKMSNKDLKWETTVTRNIGLDYGFFNDRLNGSVELYWNNTSDLLIDFPVIGSGYTTQTRNIGKTSNKGFEITFNGILLKKKDFQLDFTFNISVNTNRVDDLGGLTSSIYNSAWTSDAQASNDFIIQKGAPVGQMYGYVTDGMYSVNDFSWGGTEWILKDTTSLTPLNKGIDGDSWGPGALKLKDLNGDGQINEVDKEVIGNAIPKHTGGFTLNAIYKGIDFGASFNWVYGNDIYNANKIEFTTANKYKYRNMLSDVNSSVRWNNIDPANGQRVTDPTQLNALNANASIWNPAISKYVFHSWAVEDGSFLRLNNITLGYTIPIRWTKKINIQKLRFYISAYNLHVWTNYSGYDPEVDTRRSTPITPGVDYSAYPKSRSYNFGVNITF